MTGNDGIIRISEVCRQTDRRWSARSRCRRGSEIRTLLAAVLQDTFSLRTDLPGVYGDTVLDEL